ncbi:MAG: hypothetical protein RML36_15330 [Anaerolineae bacterium]|nr:hypothetical protein [Anaerolineae bacterium]
MEGAAEFHQLDIKWRILDGSNRSGKTLAAAVEVARAVTARDPFDKYLHHNGKCIIVGLDTETVATLYRKLFEPGAFKIIFDEEKRAFRPIKVVKKNGRLQICEKDLALRSQWVDAPPLIPSRYVSSISWYDMTRRVPASIRLTNGWVLLFRSSLGKPPQGEHYDLAWIDEAIGNDQFFYEIARGIVDVGSAKKSKAIWSACPQIPNYQLWELRREAEAGSTRVAAFRLLIEDNPYIDQEEKQAFFNSLSPQERQTRYYGYHAIDTLRAYPYFRPEDPWVYDPFKIPSDWTIYMGVDPGTTRCGTVLCAVSPDGTVWVFDAFAVSGGVDLWADTLKSRWPEDLVLHCAVIDPVAGRSRQMTGLATVARIYFLAMVNRGIKPELTGPLDGFFSGETNRDVRRELLCQGFRKNDRGEVRVRIARGSTQTLSEEIMSASAVRPRRYGAEPDRDLLDALEYVYSLGPVFKPRRTKPPLTESERMYAAFLKERSRSSSGTLVTLPGIEIARGVLL